MTAVNRKSVLIERRYRGMPKAHSTFGRNRKSTTRLAKTHRPFRFITALKKTEILRPEPILMGNLSAKTFWSSDTRSPRPRDSVAQASRLRGQPASRLLTTKTRRQFADCWHRAGKRYFRSAVNVLAPIWTTKSSRPG